MAERLALDALPHAPSPHTLYPTPGVVKIAYFRKCFLSPFLFLYKLGAILDF
jgi:hypothetical protein